MNNNPNATTVSGALAGDDASVLAAISGDEQAFGVLVQRYQRKIFAVALRYVRVREDAEDIVQETFQKAFIHLHKFEGKSCFSTWLTRIAINEALMLLRKGRAMREVPIEEPYTQGRTAPALEIPDESPDPEVTYLQGEKARILSAAMAQLRPGMQRAIELQELNELTARESARRMGLSAAAVKARVFHGRRKLRKILRSFEIAPRNIQRLTVASVANRTCASLR